MTSTAVALSVFTPSTSSSPTAAAASSAAAAPSASRSAQPTPTPAPSSAASKPPTISIQLDRRPWPHVAHAGSSSVDSLTSAGAARKGAETTVIVYGLDPGRDYEISLDVVGGEEGGEEQHHQASVEIETGVEGELCRCTSAASIRANTLLHSQAHGRARSSSQHPPTATSLPAHLLRTLDLLPPPRDHHHHTRHPSLLPRPTNLSFVPSSRRFALRRNGPSRCSTLPSPPSRRVSRRA